MTSDWAQIAKRRSSTWWLLSRLVTEPPEDPWLAELEAVLSTVDSDPQRQLGAESAALLAALQNARMAGLTALAVDRTHLLAGVMHKQNLSAPYESAARGAPMNSELVVNVAQHYLDAGLVDFSSELGPPDFLGTELRFMALLAFQEMQAHQAGDSGLAAQWLARQLGFLDEHLLCWVPDHCQRLAGMAKTDFYQSSARLIEQACLLDRADLMQISSQLAQSLSEGVAQQKAVV